MDGPLLNCLFVDCKSKMAATVGKIFCIGKWPSWIFRSTQKKIVMCGLYFIHRLTTASEFLKTSKEVFSYFRLNQSRIQEFKFCHSPTWHPYFDDVPEILQ
jgi:hypothetical protein